MERPVVNAWTEFGDLEYVCVGSALGHHYSNHDPANPLNRFTNKEFEKYMILPIGGRPSQRIKRAEAELQNLVEILEGESIAVGTVNEVDEDINEELRRKRSYIAETPSTVTEDKRVKKAIVEVFRPPHSNFDHLIMTPWFKNYYQFGHSCPRDCITTIGNTILETPTPSRVRYFESTYHRPNIYKWWRSDSRVHWKTAPQPSCGDTLYDDLSTFEKSQLPFYKTTLNDSEVAFDAADMMRAGKDIFYKRSDTANNMGINWLRKEFPDLRFHMLHFPTDTSCHLDVNLALLRPPSSGSEGIVMLNQTRPPLKSELKLFTDNDWKPIFGPLPVTTSVIPVAACSPNLNLNFLSLSPSCCIIEECEVPLYHMLEDMGWDVITCPLRSLNEFGGGVHCVTWDVRRNDSCKDYFPNQDYATECKIDLENFDDRIPYEG